MRYAQIDKTGRVVAMLDTAAWIVAPNMISMDSESDVLGMRWTGSGFEPVIPTEKEAALARLAELDAQSGMPRLMRETLRAIAGAQAPAALVAVEAEAAAEREKLRVAK